MKREFDKDSKYTKNIAKFIMYLGVVLVLLNAIGIIADIIDFFTGFKGDFFP